MEEALSTEAFADEADGDFSVSENLDENGFPFPPLSSECEGERAADPSMDEDVGSFAADFYRNGTDWSCLKGKESDEKEDRKLIQTDLFKMWGLTKPCSASKFGGVSSSPRPKKKMKISVDGCNSIRDRSDWKVDCSGSETVVGRRVGQQQSRVCPFYKKIPGTPFTVDAFRYGLIEGCEAYFLSHFHYDHYGGLSKKWSHGPIYCSPLTARLVKLCLGVNQFFIRPLELDTRYIIEGIQVTMLEANHCPGAALIHFRTQDGHCYLHSGDFRACKLMQTYPILLNHRVNILYLDTTYCNPRYRFPSKEHVVGFVVRIARSALGKQPKTLIVVGAYSIGKEHVYIAISQALGVNVFTDASRRRILQSFGWPELSEKLCSLGQNTPLHVLPISSLRHESLQKYLKTYGQRFTAVLAFRPTGWCYSEAIGNQLDLIKPNSKGNVKIYGVPYSEHSNFLELREFVQVPNIKDPEFGNSFHAFS